MGSLWKWLKTSGSAYLAKILRTSEYISLHFWVVNKVLEGRGVEGLRTSPYVTKTLGH